MDRCMVHRDSAAHQRLEVSGNVERQGREALPATTVRVMARMRQSQSGTRLDRPLPTLQGLLRNVMPSPLWRDRGPRGMRCLSRTVVPTTRRAAGPARALQTCRSSRRARSSNRPQLPHRPTQCVHRLGRPPLRDSSYGDPAHLPTLRRWRAVALRCSSQACQITVRQVRSNARTWQRAHRIRKRPTVQPHACRQQLLLGVIQAAILSSQHRVTHRQRLRLSLAKHCRQREEESVRRGPPRATAAALWSHRARAS